MRRGLRAVVGGLFALALSARAHAAYYVNGDSFSQGQVAQFCGFTCLIEVKLDAPVTSKSVSGGMCGDLVPQALTVNTAAGDVVIVETGTNGQRHYGINATLQAAHLDCMRALVGWLAIANKVTARAVSGESPTMTDTGIENIGRSSYPLGTVGTTKTFTNVCGTAIDTAVINVDTGGTAAPYAVSIDGVLRGNYASSIAGLTSINGYNYADGAKRFSVGSGCHTVVLTQTGAGYLYVQWVAGNQQTVYPTVIVTNIIRQGTTPGCGYSVFGGSDANVASYNADIAALVAEFQADGFDVRLADINAAVNNTTDLATTDCLHPVQSGHNKMGAVIWNAISGTGYQLP